MLEEFEKSVKATLYDRLASPLIGSYVTAWCIFNYKVILIIFSDLQYTQKSEYIDALFAPWWNYPVRYGFPLLWSAFYILFYPWISKKVFRIWQQYIKDKRDIKNKIEGSRLLTLAESEAIRTEYLQSENKLAELMQNNQKELQEWKDRYNLLLEEKQQLQKQLSLHTKSAVTDKAETNDTQNADLQNNSLWQAEMLELPIKAIELLKKVVSAKSERFHRTDFNHRSFLFFDNHEKILLTDNEGEFLYKLIDYGLLEALQHDYYKVSQKGYRFINYLEKQNSVVD